MKRILCVSVLAVFFFACNSKKTETKKETNMEKTAAVSAKVKVHECSAACTGENHVFMHNEIGHTCSSDCGNPHVCTDKCGDNSHVYAHGEVGHYCLCTPGS